MNMPIIDMSALNLSESDAAIAQGIIATRGENKGRLRASAPKVAVTGKVEGYFGSMVNAYNQQEAESYYVWRMVAFYVSPMSQHHCMPVMDDQYLGGSYDARKARAKELDKLVDAIVNTIPRSQWHGVTRWGRALGYTG